MSNMYELSVRQWNPYVGCLHNCSYCNPSFQAQLKRWAKSHCRLCYDFKPHYHKERLCDILPRTKYMQFIFTCSNGDVAFCRTPFLQAIIKRIKREPDKTFLIQSKDPSTFSRVKFPSNVILGTTIETNRDDIVKKISKAPLPSARIEAFKNIEHKLKMLTYEPIMLFDLEQMLDIAKWIKPAMIWMGYDSKNCKLEEPALCKFKQLHWELSSLGFVVILKTVREAWWEN